MKVEIWSDVMCPFCYIGKRRFEEALAKFPNADEVEITWKSFQLNPEMVTDPSISIHQYLADAKGWQLDYAKQMAAQVTEMAAGVGLTFNMDNAVVANSFNAHRFSHLATANGLGDAAEEALFKAYFTDGKNTDDIKVLTQLGVSISLKAEEIEGVLASDKYADEVKQDILEAGQIGVRGVPFFVFDRKYAVSGAQPMELFLQTLEKAKGEEF
ncbi:DsbA family oxidoreductase [Mucilaginibacter myungsuensis]|uniref:DsbA family oxidoreductase n=1 Tax=Mucilaginibacter myungsuensis TaxID=649104 RepID=A0A929PYI1_9SPHI|nr:DsbA family oxidoreductase [Mucilaginibacter myungsuensis]MBE9664296.1 DsbA family oxidoreductase [Mucilaginibacter myungsuensis]MDN3600000.1 DsbA family oxidoreductase [Mucilaginibacter myungsuensis]